MFYPVVCTNKLDLIPSPSLTLLQDIQTQLAAEKSKNRKLHDQLSRVRSEVVALKTSTLDRCAYSINEKSHSFAKLFFLIFPSFFFELWRGIAPFAPFPLNTPLITNIQWQNLNFLIFCPFVHIFGLNRSNYQIKVLNTARIQNLSGFKMDAGQ